MTSAMKAPKIGERRVYGETIAVLHPGERAVAASVKVEGDELRVTSWIVEAAPGWRAWWLRLRYRVWGRFVQRWYGGPPRLEVNVDAVPRDPTDEP